MKHVAINHQRRRISAWVTVALLATSAVPSAWAQGQGLTIDDASQLAPRLQARVGVTTSLALTDSSQASWQQQAGVLLGDYYFSRARLGSGQRSSGFRATSGILLGQRSLAMATPALASSQGMGLTLLRQHRAAVPGVESAAEAWTAVPYFGVGWSGGSARGGWGVTADFGFAGRGAGSNGGLRLNSQPTLDDVLRDVRLTPMVQVGVSYAF